MASSNQQWLTPYQRSYNSIKSKLLNSLRTKVPEITDYSEGNIFIILLSMFAAIAEVLHYYIDNMAREAFFPTARKYSSLYRHAKLVDYHIKCAVPATTDVLLYLQNNAQLQLEGKDYQVIPEGIEFTATDGSVWRSSKAVTWYNGTYSVRIPLIQKEKSSENIDLGYITSNNAQIYFSPSDKSKYYVEGSMILRINNQAWTLVDTFAYANATDKVYMIEPDNNGNPRIFFGDGIHGMKPDLNAPVRGEYWITNGTTGNITEGSFTSVPQEITNLGISGVQISHPEGATGGSSYETFSMMKDHVPLSLKTLGVAITKEDFEAVARQVPGVNKAYCEYICGQILNLIIMPDVPDPDEATISGVEAGTALLDTVAQYVAKSKVITTSVSVTSTHKALIYIDGEIWGQKSFSKSDILNEAKKQLINAFNPSTSDISKPIRISDIYAMIDNMDTVEYWNINRIYVVSYARPSRANTEDYSVVPLNITYFNQIKYVPATYLEEGQVDKIDVAIEIGDDVTKFNLWVDGRLVKSNCNFDEQISVETSRTAFQITIGTGNGTYNPNIRYTFSLQPMNVNLTPLDYNIPVFEDSTITLSVHESV